VTLAGVVEPATRDAPQHRRQFVHGAGTPPQMVSHCDALPLRQVQEASGSQIGSQIPISHSKLQVLPAWQSSSRHCPPRQLKSHTEPLWQTSSLQRPELQAKSQCAPSSQTTP